MGQEQVSLFVTVDLFVRIGLTLFLTYFTIKYRNQLMYWVMGISTISLYLATQGLIKQAELVGEPIAFLLVYILIKYMRYEAGYYNLQQKNAPSQGAEHKVVLTQDDNKGYNIKGKYGIDGRIVTWPKSSQDFYGYTADEAIGRDVDFLIPAGVAKDKQKILDILEKGDSLVDYHTKRTLKSGEIVPVILTIHPVKNSEGEIVGAHVYTQPDKTPSE